MMAGHFIAVLSSFLLDLFFGDPPVPFHPVRLIGGLISALEKALRRKERPERRFALGVVLVILVLLITLASVLLLLLTAYHFSPVAGVLMEAFLGYWVLSTKSLRRESGKVADFLEKDDLEGARKAVSMLVSRDTGRMKREDVIRAAVETVAENTTDGSIAPLFFLALGGPVLAFLYKAVNTMDSMIGYRTERYLEFGRAAARLDDAANFVPARLAALLMLVSSGVLVLDTRNAWRIFLRDRNRTESPNAGQTEAVCAGALGIALGGSASYFGRKVERAVIGDALRDPESGDIAQANALMSTATVLLLFAALFVMALLLLTEWF